MWVWGFSTLQPPTVLLSGAPVLQGHGSHWQPSSSTPSPHPTPDLQQPKAGAEPALPPASSLLRWWLKRRKRRRRKRQGPGSRSDPGRVPPGPEQTLMVLGDGDHRSPPGPPGSRRRRRKKRRCSRGSSAACAEPVWEPRQWPALAHGGSQWPPLLAATGGS